MNQAELSLQPVERLRWQSFLALTKPRVVSLVVFCAVIGMFLATPGQVPWRILVFGTLGIALVSGAAAAFNCLIEQRIDALMARTKGRPLPKGRVSEWEVLGWASVLCAIGMLLLFVFTNTFTMWITFATFIGYAVIYTVILKPATPQNIVIGGLSGAMPPALGWAAVTGSVSPEAWLLVLIIFTWTPPHFWALALYRADDYARAGLPMLPVTHGPRYTRLHILLYTFILVATTLLPVALKMSGWIYLASALLLGAGFLSYAWRIYRVYSDALAQATFRYSIWYLSLLFGVLLLDHYALFPVGA